MAVTIQPGDVINEMGDLYTGPRSPALAAGRIQVTMRQAVQAMNYGWRCKAAQATDRGLMVSIQRDGETWMKRRR